MLEGVSSEKVLFWTWVRRSSGCLFGLGVTDVQPQSWYLASSCGTNNG